MQGFAIPKAVGRRSPAGREGCETRAAASMWRPLRAALGEIKLKPSQNALELVAGSYQVARVQLLSEEQVGFVAAISPHTFLEEVDALEGDQDVVGEVVADVQVQLPEGLIEHRVPGAL